MGKPQVQLSERTLKAMAEALFLAYTVEQAAILGGISPRTLARLKQTEQWQQIQNAALLMEKPYRLKVFNGSNGWQGAAWMLERKYASQLSKPEVQLQLNTGEQVVNQTLVITAEQATSLRNRNAVLDLQLAKLTPPSNRLSSQSNVGSDNIQPAEVSPPNNDDMSSTDGRLQHDKRTSEFSVTAATPPAPAGGTPDVGVGDGEPKLPQKSKNFETPESGSSITESGSVIEKPIRRGRPPKKRELPLGQNDCTSVQTGPKAAKVGVNGGRIGRPPGSRNKEKLPVPPRGPLRYKLKK